MKEKYQNPKVSAILDYIIEVEGKFNYQQGQFFTIKNKSDVKTFVLSASEGKAYLLADDKNNNIEIDDELIPIDEMYKINTSNDFFGKIIDVTGEIVYPNIKTKSFAKGKHETGIFAKPVGMMEREILNDQLFTGILAIDLFIPIGLGQRELIIGDRQTGKTHIALNAIINQSIRGTKCIYVNIGQKQQNLSYVYNALKKYGNLSNIIIVDAPSTSAYQQYLAPYVAMAHAENLSFDNDVLIVFDDLTKHANIYREISLLINQPIGKEAFPGDMFFAHSKLLERSGKFINRKSITALPILKTINNDLTSLISSNIISITDGQIVTNTDLYTEGKIPAINLDFSVSRTGSFVQKKNVRKTATELMKIYSLYKKQINLATFQYDWNSATTDLIFKGKSIEKMLIQKGFNLHSEKYVSIMTKLINWGTFKNVPETKDSLQFINALVSVDPNGKRIYQHLILGEDFDENLMKNYFFNALNQFYKHQNLDIQLEQDFELVKFSPQELSLILENMKEF